MDKRFNNKRKIVMKKILAMVVMCGLITGFSGCVTAPFTPPMGAISTIEAPLSIDHNCSLVSTKKGEASAMCILGLVAVGDASTQAAARNGGLKTIHFLDYKYFNVLGIYQSTTVIAHGE